MCDSNDSRGRIYLTFFFLLIFLKKFENLFYNKTIEFLSL